MNEFFNILKTKGISKIYGAILILSIWHIASVLIDSNIVPSPVLSIPHFIKAILEKDLIFHIAHSLKRITISIVLSVVIGLPLGILMGMSRKWEYILRPLIYIGYPIPKIAFLPVMMIIFGLGDSSKIALIFSIIIFQIVIGTRDAIKEIPNEVHLSAKSLNLNLKFKIIHIIIPSILPKLLTALRISIGISISALFFAENFATSYGIGYFIMNSFSMVDYMSMFSGIIAISLMGLLIFKIIDKIEKRLCGWL